MNDAFFWLLLNVISTIANGFYSMTEMACVSLNKVRLHYWVEQKNKKALMLNWLLQHPFRLFGTTLIGVNVATTVGSECAREFHSAIGVNPDFAPLSQVFIVIIFGELAPMFAARHFSEHVAWLGARLTYASAKIMTPFLWLIGAVSSAVNVLVRSKDQTPHLFLNQEELQKVLEEKSDETLASTEDFNEITANIFHLKNRDAKSITTPFRKLPTIESQQTVKQAISLFGRTDSQAIAIINKAKGHVVGILTPRNLLRAPNHKKARDFADSPWFVTENTPLSTLLHQFQNNQELVAVIVDKKGKSVGLVTLDDVLEEIFGKSTLNPFAFQRQFILERTFAGTTTVGELKKQFGVQLDQNSDLTLAGVLEKHLGRFPEVEDSIMIDRIEIIAKECSLLEVVSVLVKGY